MVLIQTHLPEFHLTFLHENQIHENIAKTIKHVKLEKIQNPSDLMKLM